MALRPEEMFVLFRIINWLGGSDLAKSREGEDPPDAYITVGDVTSLLEITQLSEFIVNKDGSIESRLTQEMFGMRLSNELDKQFRDSIQEGISLLINLKLPVARPSIFKNQLHQAVHELILDGNFPKKWKTLIVDGEKVGILATQRDPAGLKRIIGIIESKNASPIILPNAQAILDNRLNIKNEICANLPFKGPRWLALLNQYWLADVETYRLALRESKVIHQFERIFFVQDTGDVQVLYDKKTN